MKDRQERREKEKTGEQSNREQAFNALQSYENQIVRLEELNDLLRIRLAEAGNNSNGVVNLPSFSSSKYTSKPKKRNNSSKHAEVSGSGMDDISILSQYTSSSNLNRSKSLSSIGQHKLTSIRHGRGKLTPLEQTITYR